MPVNRCICHQISFEDIKKIAKEQGFQSVRELQAEKVCSTNCKLCEPYVERLLKTGQVSFQPLYKK